MVIVKVNAQVGAREGQLHCALVLADFGWRHTVEVAAFLLLGTIYLPVQDGSLYVVRCKGYARHHRCCHVLFKNTYVFQALTTHNGSTS